MCGLVGFLSWAGVRSEAALAALAGLSGRRILTHINNTNPILIEGSVERRKVEDAGIEIAEDGMEIVL